jgi:Reverse transcriptase (RNA-dependent DNA polymerase)
MMTPIDSLLSDNDIVWHRYVDDFTLITKSPQTAYRALSVLSHSLADYGLTLNRSKTTIMQATHYVDFVAAQLGATDDPTSIIREIDLHFDPYSDNAYEHYESLKDTVEQFVLLPL